MLQTGKIKIRSLKELQEGYVDLAESELSVKTPLRKLKKQRRIAATTTKKENLQNDENNKDVLPDTTVKKKVSRSALKEPPPWQKPIDSYFKSCQKNYKIEPMKEEPPPTPIRKQQRSTRKTIQKSKNKCTATTTTKKTTNTVKRTRAGRKRLFVESESTTETETSYSYERKKQLKTATKTMQVDCITIISDSEEEEKEGDENLNEIDKKCDLDISTSATNAIENIPKNSGKKKSAPLSETWDNQPPTSSNRKTSPTSSEETLKNNSTPFGKRSSTNRNKFSSAAIEDISNENSSKPSTSRKSSRNKTTTDSNDNKTSNKSTSSPPSVNISKEITSSSINNRRSPRTKSAPTSPDNNEIFHKPSSATLSSSSSGDKNITGTSNSVSKSPVQPLISTTSVKTLTKRKQKPCPSYKIIEGTTFAVDAFQFGAIENVTHYFLTHFHADHYIGLTKKFSMPLYVSPITARFLREFIPIDEQYIHELELNEPHTIDNIEITAVDANHCPGAVQFIFKFLNTDKSNPKPEKCILHTGDFRAWHGMESEPIFWNNDIHTIYLDTTYINDKYAFCTQYESINKAIHLIDKFREKHQGKRILYICGSYVIGKEKFWSALAEKYQMKVWLEGNRRKAVKAMEDEGLNKIIIEDRYEADMHVIAMVKLSYLHLVEYFAEYEHNYDIVFAIRPSGWEKDTKPQYRGKINIIGIEYSEHSSYAEMQRFVKFLKPQNVISTVPTNGRDLMKTAKVPQNWYKYEVLKSYSKYQPTIDSYLGKTPRRKTIRPPNMNKGGLENFVSPLSLAKKGKPKEINNNNVEDEQEEEGMDVEEDQQQVISIYSSENNNGPENGTIKLEQPLMENENEAVDEEIPELSAVKYEPIVEIEIVNKSQTIKLTNLNGKKQLETKKIKKTQKTITNVIEIENYSKPTSLANNSEDFEMPEIINSQNKFNINMQKVLDKNIKSKKQQNIPKDDIISISNSNSQKPKSIANSSDYFELPEIVNTQNKIHLTTKDKPPKSSLKPMEHNNGSIQISKIKKKLQFVNASPNYLEDNIPSTSKAAKLKYQQQQEIAKVANPEDDFEMIPISQRTKRGLTRKTTEKKKPEKSKSTTTTSGEETEIPLAQRKRRKKENLINAPNKDYENMEDKFDKELAKLTKHTNGNRVETHTPISKNTTQTPVNKSHINPLFKSTTISNCSNSTEDEIAASQMEHTPRLWGNKKSILTQPLSYKATLIKNDQHLQQKDLKSTTIKKPQDLTQKDIKPFDAKLFFNDLMENNQDIDFYNPSQMVNIVEETLSKQICDNSTDHIPIELLSNSDGTSNKSQLKLRYNSSTSSNCSTFADDIAASQTTKQQEYSPRPLRDKIKGQKQSTYTATTIKRNNELDKTTTPSRNNEISTLETPKPQEVEEYSPRPLKHKTRDQKQPPYTATTIKRNNETDNTITHSRNNGTSVSEIAKPQEVDEYRPRPLKGNKTAQIQPTYTATIIKKSNNSTNTKVITTLNDKEEVSTSRSSPLLNYQKFTDPTSTAKIKNSQTAAVYNGDKISTSRSIPLLNINKKSTDPTSSGKIKNSQTTRTSQNKPEMSTSHSSQHLQRPEYISQTINKNKRSAVTRPPTPIKRAKNQQNSTASAAPFNSQKVLKTILETNQDLDFYNPSQMTMLVEETLSKQCFDNSTDHIPAELLSDPDADDDWMN